MLLFLHDILCLHQHATGYWLHTMYTIHTILYTHTTHTLHHTHHTHTYRYVSWSISSLILSSPAWQQTQEHWPPWLIPCAWYCMTRCDPRWWGCRQWTSCVSLWIFCRERCVRVCVCVCVSLWIYCRERWVEYEGMCGVCVWVGGLEQSIFMCVCIYERARETEEEHMCVCCSIVS